MNTNDIRAKIVIRRVKKLAQDEDFENFNEGFDA